MVSNMVFVFFFDDAKRGKMLGIPNDRNSRVNDETWKRVNDNWNL